MKKQKFLLLSILLLGLFSCVDENDDFLNVNTKEEQKMDIKSHAIFLNQSIEGNVAFRSESEFDYSLENVEESLNHALNMKYFQLNESRYNAMYNSNKYPVNAVIEDIEGEKELYNIALRSAAKFYQSIENSDKTPGFIMIDLISNDGILVDSIQVITMASTGQIIPDVPLSNYPYSETWYPAFNGGTCNPHLPRIYEDALDQWRRDINRRIYVDIKNTNINGYQVPKEIGAMLGELGIIAAYEVPEEIYENVDWVLEGMETENTTHPNIPSMHWVYNHPNNSCIEPDQMNYHYNAIYDGFANEANLRGLKFLRYENGYSFLPVGGTDYPVFQTAFIVIGDIEEVASVDQIDLDDIRIEEIDTP